MQQRFLHQVDSLQQLRARLTDHLNKLTIKEFLPLILIYLDGSTKQEQDYPDLEARVKVVWSRHIIPLNTEKTGASNSHIIELALRFLTQNEVATSPSIPRQRSLSDLIENIPNMLKPSDWIEKYCGQHQKTIFAWNFNDDEDSLFWHFFCDGIKMLSRPEEKVDILHKIQWFQKQMEQNCFYFFVVYDQGRRIDLIHFKLEILAKVENSLHLWQCFNQSQFSTREIKQRFSLVFDKDEILPHLFNVPTTIDQLIGCSEIYCRHASDYKVAFMGLFNSLTHEWECRNDQLLSKEGDKSSHTIFHLIVPKAGVTHLLPHHYLNLIAVVDTQEYDIIDAMPTTMLVPLLRRPDFYNITFTLSRQACKSITTFRLEFPPHHHQKEQEEEEGTIKDEHSYSSSSLTD